MRYRNLGASGLKVSELCLGAMTFGGTEGVYLQFGALNQTESNRLVAAAYDAGINMIDTADAYADGESEVITGRAIRDLGIRRDEIVIATKAFGPTGSGPNTRGNSRGHLMDAVKASLSRLGTDHIDLYQLHGIDPHTPLEETIRALDLLIQQGHIRYVGVSNFTAWQIMKALGIADRLDIPRLVSNQAYYSIAGRDLERELVPMMQAEGIGLLVWSPLAGGLLSGKYRQGVAGRRDGFAFPPVDLPRADALLDAMEPMAAARGVSVAQIAIAWLLHQPVVTSVIVGAKRSEQLADNIAATEISLAQEELATLDAIGRPPPEYPGWMLDFQRRILDGERPASDTQPVVTA